MANKVLTAPKAFISIDNKAAGYIRDLSFTENIQRAEIAGLGSLVNQETPATKQTNQFSVGEFFINFKHPSTKALLNRLGGAQALLNTLTLGEFPFSIVIYAKTIEGTDANNRLVTQIDKTGETIAVLRDCYTDSQAFNLSEAGIAGFNTTGRYLTPVTSKET
jgi:hypothetical protein